MVNETIDQDAKYVFHFPNVQSILLWLFQSQDDPQITTMYNKSNNEPTNPRFLCGPRISSKAFTSFDQGDATSVGKRYLFGKLGQYFLVSAGSKLFGIGPIGPKRLNRAHWPTKENRQQFLVFFFFNFSVRGKLNPTWARSFLSINPDLPSNWGDTDFDFETVYFLIFWIPHFQIRTLAVPGGLPAPQTFWRGACSPPCPPCGMFFLVV